MAARWTATALVAVAASVWAPASEAGDLAIGGVSIGLGSARHDVLARLAKHRFAVASVNETPDYFLISRKPAPEFEPIGEVQFAGDAVVRVGAIWMLSERAGLPAAFERFHAELGAAVSAAGASAELSTTMQHDRERNVRTVIADFPGRRVSLLFSMPSGGRADPVVATIQHSVVAR